MRAYHTEQAAPQPPPHPPPGQAADAPPLCFFTLVAVRMFLWKSIKKMMNATDNKTKKIDTIYFNLTFFIPYPIFLPSLMHIPQGLASHPR